MKPLKLGHIVKNATESYRQIARKGDVNMIQAQDNSFEVWDVTGRLGDPQTFTDWDKAVEAYEYALVGYNVTTKQGRPGCPTHVTG